LSKKSNIIAWRRAKVLELTSKGQTQVEIAETMKLLQSQIHKDLEYCKQQAKDTIANYLNQFLPEEYQKCFIGIKNVLKKSWSIIDDEKQDDVKNKIAALALCNQAYNLQVQLITNSEVISDALEYVEKSHKTKTRQLDRSLKSEIEQLEKQTQTEQTTTTTTTNTVF
jgi:hypothetical protein